MVLPILENLVYEGDLVVFYWEEKREKLGFNSYPHWLFCQRKNHKLLQCLKCISSQLLCGHNIRKLEGEVGGGGGGGGGRLQYFRQPLAMSKQHWDFITTTPLPLVLPNLKTKSTELQLLNSLSLPGVYLNRPGQSQMIQRIQKVQ